MSNKRIGGDFNSLFDDNNMEESEGLRTLRLSEIEPNKGQPRKVFDKEAMEQLAESIRVNGVLQPLLAPAVYRQLSDCCRRKTLESS